jgi:sugar phosphate isomerase/epimerase
MHAMIRERRSSSLSRRRFLGGLAAAAAAPSLARAQPAGAPKIFGKPVGIQLYSLRDYIPKDVPGTLAKIRAMGFTDVEGGSDYKMGVEAFKAELAKAGLKVTSAHFGYEDWGKDAAAQIARAQAFSLTLAGCAWIPHKGAFSREDCLRAAADFNKWGKAAKDARMRYFYHLHGYEFQASPEGTFFDLLAKETDPSLVFFQADVYWLTHGGANPVALFEKYPKRWVSTHLKDMAKGTPVGLTTGQADVETNVVLGTGTIDWPAVLRAANKAGVERHFIEDESSRVLDQVPKTLDYLRGLKLS